MNFPWTLRPPAFLGELHGKELRCKEQDGRFN